MNGPILFAALANLATWISIGLALLDATGLVTLPWYVIAGPVWAMVLATALFVIVCMVVVLLTRGDAA